jgi:preprotein translocase subunit YajC
LAYDSRPPRVSPSQAQRPGRLPGRCTINWKDAPVMGNAILANAPTVLAAGSTKSSSSLLPIILIVVLFMVVYMTMTRRSRARQAQQQQSNVVPGTRVRTTSGMYGTVTSLEGNDDVMIEVAPGVNIRMMRRAVVPVPQDAASGTGPMTEPSPEPTDESTGDDDHEPRADDWNPQDRNI